MTKKEKDILIRVYNQQMKEATRQHSHITTHMTDDLSETVIARRRACVNTAKRMQALIEQLQGDTNYRRLKTGRRVGEGKVGEPREGSIVDRTIHIDPKDPFFRDKIPATIPE